jgi:hypothetical protein
VYRSKIKFIKLTGANFLVQDPERLSIFCGNNYTAGVPVNAVTQGRSK